MFRRKIVEREGPGQTLPNFKMIWEAWEGRRRSTKWYIVVNYSLRIRPTTSVHDVERAYNYIERDDVPPCCLQERAYIPSVRSTSNKQGQARPSAALQNPMGLLLVL